MLVNGGAIVLVNIKLNQLYEKPTRMGRRYFLRNLIPLE